MKSNYNKTDRYRNQGFTLIELGVVLMVMGMMATSVVPTLIAQTRDKMADRVVRDFQQLNNAALLFRADQDPSRWPGYDENCENLTGGETWFAELEEAGYIPDINAAPKNPWDNPDNAAQSYTFVADNSTGQCLATIISADTIPESVYTYIQNTSSLNTLCNAAENNCRQIVVAGGAGAGAGGALAEEGQIAMFDNAGGAGTGGCPLNWEPVESLNNGRFPRGIAAGGGTFLEQGSSNTIDVNYTHGWIEDPGDFMDAFTNTGEESWNVEELSVDPEILPADVHAAFMSIRALQGFSFNVNTIVNGTTTTSNAGSQGTFTSAENAADAIEILPPYTNVLYCQYTP